MFRIFAIGSRFSRTFASSYAFEYFWLFFIWVMGLIGAAIATVSQIQIVRDSSSLTHP